MANPKSEYWMPGDLTLASYSHQGFYEMFAIICVTVTVVLLINRYVKKNESGRIPALTKLALMILTLCDFIIVASAASRLIAYVRDLNLTVTRLMVLILIGMIALYLLIIVVKLWIEKLPIAGIMVSLAIVTAIILGGINVNAVVANYNADRYLREETKRIDIKYMGRLGAPAAPALDRLITEGKEEDARLAELQLANIYYKMDDDHITSWTYDKQVAKEIMEKHGICRSEGKDRCGY